MLDLLQQRDQENIAVYIAHFHRGTNLGPRWFEIYKELTKKACKALKIRQDKLDRFNRLHRSSSQLSQLSTASSIEDFEQAAGQAEQVRHDNEAIENTTGTTAEGGMEE